MDLLLKDFVDKFPPVQPASLDNPESSSKQEASEQQSQTNAPRSDTQASQPSEPVEKKMKFNSR